MKKRKILQLAISIIDFLLLYDHTHTYLNRMSCSSLSQSFMYSLRRVECSAHLRPRRKSLIFGRLPLEVAQFRHSNRQSESANQQS